MMHKEKVAYRTLAKSTTLLGGSQVIQMGVMFIRVKIVAVLLGPTGMGINSLILSALMVMQQISSVGIFHSGVREMSIVSTQSNGSTVLAKFRNIFLRLTLICGTIGMIVMALLSPFFSFFLFGDYSYTWWLAFAAIALLFMNLQSGYNTIMQATRKLGLMAKATIVGAILGLIVVILLFFFLRQNGIVPAIVFGYAIFFFSSRYFESKIPFEKVERFDKEEFVSHSKPILKLGIVLMASNIVASLFSLFLNSFISHIGSVDDVGYYQSATSIITQGMFITNIMLVSDFYPRLSAVCQDNKQMKTVIRQQTDVLIYIIAPISVLIIVFAPVIVWLLLSPKFVMVAGLLQIMAIGLIAKVVWTTMSYIILAKGDKKTYFLFDALLGNGVNFVISIVSFHFWGLQGLALSYIIGVAFMVALLWVVTRIRCKVSLDVNQLVEVLIMTLFMVFAYFFATYAQGVTYWVGLAGVSIIVVFYSLWVLNKKINIFELVLNKIKR